MSAPAAIGKPRTVEVLDSERAEQNAALVELAHADPEAGLSELHRRFAGTVNRLVWRLLGPDPDHDDLVQQVFFAMLTSVRQLRDPSKLDVWVRTVTVNAVDANWNLVASVTDTVAFLFQSRYPNPFCQTENPFRPITTDAPGYRCERKPRNRAGLHFSNSLKE